ncbi:MAG: phosphotriesterase [Cyclobacteriaceae bacterium]|nr:phosphotriesterase [Cyclobacteriaceae bacterium]
MNRIDFVIIAFLVCMATGCGKTTHNVITVNGVVAAEAIGTTLPHEHILVDFIGADSIRPGRYTTDSVVAKALPYLIELKSKDCQTFIDCTPNYIGRDVNLLQRLSLESGVNIVTNTGYYGAAGQKYLPHHAFTESAEQLADRWIQEFENGIDETAIKPGFIKLGADAGPLTGEQKKIMKAGAITHLKTGLTIAVHSGDGNAAREELKIFLENGVAPDAFIWVHAQNEKDFTVFHEIASQGAWVEFDGLNADNTEEYVNMLTYMKKHSLLQRTLVSHDAGWYHVGEKNGGDFRAFTSLFTNLIPRLKEEGFSEEDIDQLIGKNPGEAFAVRIRRKV